MKSAFSLLLIVLWVVVGGFCGVGGLFKTTVHLDGGVFLANVTRVVMMCA